MLQHVRNALRDLQDRYMLPLTHSVMLTDDTEWRVVTGAHGPLHIFAASTVGEDLDYNIDSQLRLVGAAGFTAVHLPRWTDEAVGAAHSHGLSVVMDLTADPADDDGDRTRHLHVVPGESDISTLLYCVETVYRAFARGGDVLLATEHLLRGAPLELLQRVAYWVWKQQPHRMQSDPPGGVLLAKSQLSAYDVVGDSLQSCARPCVALQPLLLFVRAVSTATVGTIGFHGTLGEVDTLQRICDALSSCNPDLVRMLLRASQEHWAYLPITNTTANTVLRSDGTMQMLCVVNTSLTDALVVHADFRGMPVAVSTTPPLCGPKAARLHAQSFAVFETAGGVFS
jgi:hypothetical protein